jgi:AcrR family transcriptional regulator
MSKYKYKFTLHQVYAHYADHGNLNWRDVAESAKVSTRTLRNYFASTENLAQLLIEYHIKYLENYYTKFRIEPGKYDKFPFKLLFYVMLKHKICYLFTDKVSSSNLAGRGAEVKQIHLNYIKNAMGKGGITNSEKVDPELVFRNLILPLENSKNNEEFFNHMMQWYLK